MEISYKAAFEKLSVVACRPGISAFAYVRLNPKVDVVFI
jgi:hypothetical protein